MTSLAGVGSVALAYATVAVPPGANFLVVSRFGVAGRRDQACIAAIGVATGAALVAGVAFSGSRWLVPLLSLSGVMQVVFAAILLKLGTGALWRAYRQPPLHASGAASTCRRSFVAGLLTAISNPVTATYLFGVAADPNRFAEQCHVLLASAAVFAVAVSWFCPVALLFSHPRLRASFERRRAALDAATGCLLIALGATAVSHLLA